MMNKLFLFFTLFLLAMPMVFAQDIADITVEAKHPGEADFKEDTVEVEATFEPEVAMDTGTVMAIVIIVVLVLWLIYAVFMKHGKKKSRRKKK